MQPNVSSNGKLSVVQLLKPYAGLLGLAFAAVVGEGVTGLLEPWPLKIVFDGVSGSKPLPAWLERYFPFIHGGDKMAILEVAAAAVLIIAVLEAVCSYGEKYATTDVGQWVMRDLRRMVYSHVQH